MEKAKKRHSKVLARAQLSVPKHTYCFLLPHPYIIRSEKAGI